MTNRPPRQGTKTLGFAAGPTTRFLLILAVLLIPLLSTAAGGAVGVMFGKMGVLAGGAAGLVLGIVLIAKFAQKILVLPRDRAWAGTSVLTSDAMTVKGVRYPLQEVRMTRCASTKVWVNQRRREPLHAKALFELTAGNDSVIIGSLTLAPWMSLKLQCDIGGNQPAGRVAGYLEGEDVVALAEYLGVPLDPRSTAQLIHHTAQR